MSNQFSRTELLIGKNGIDKLQNAKVAIFGIGGVGSYVMEGLARAGVGSFILVDKDEVDESNINTMFTKIVRLNPATTQVKDDNTMDIFYSMDNLVNGDTDLVETNKYYKFDLYFAVEANEGNQASTSINSVLSAFKARAEVTSALLALSANAVLTSDVFALGATALST